MTVLHLCTASRDATIALGRLIGSRLPPGTVVCLDGDLGAGKTALTVGLAKGVGCLGPVASPTFTLLIEHAAGERGIPLYHFDVYRLPDGDAFLELGFDEYLGGGGIAVIEWSSRVRDVLPDSCLTIELNLVRPEHPDERRLTVAWPGRDAWLAELAAAWDAQVSAQNGPAGGPDGAVGDRTGQIAPDPAQEEPTC